MAAGRREQTLAVPAALLNAARSLNLEAVAACYAEDAIAISPMFGEARGREQIAATWQTLFSTFVDVSVNVADTMVDDDRVAVFINLSRVDKYGWFGRPATGETIAYRLVLILTVRDGHIVRDERLYDSAGLIERLEKARIDKELRTAGEVQRALVPRTFGTSRSCEWIGDSIPSRAIGGDFFEFIELPSDAVGMVLGDVSGKGPAAALLAALVQGMFAVECAIGGSPADVLSRINRRLVARRLESRFVTLVYGVLCPDGTLVYANAGHNPPMLLTGEGVRRLGAGGTVIGWLEHTVFEEARITLKHGDTLVMFTDGVTEARNPAGDEFGDERLAASLCGHDSAAPAALLERIFADVKTFADGAEPSDDITVTVTRFL